VVLDLGVILKNCFIGQSCSLEAYTERGEKSYMRKTIAYLLIAVIALSLTLCLIPTAHSQTENIKIVSYSWYYDSLGLLDLVGEVQNIGTNIIDQVAVQGTVTTTTGSQLQSSTPVWVQNLLPQQKAPFYMTFYTTDQSSQTTSTPDVADVQFTVIKADTTTEYQYPDLTIPTHTSSVDTTTENLGTYWVSGTLKNTGTQTAQNIRIIATFYNSAGTVVAVGGYTGASELLTTSLAPSATIDFKVGAYDINQTGISADKKIETCTLLIQVTGPLLQGTAPQITPYPTGSTSPSDTTSPTSPSNTQSPDSGNGSTSNTTESSLPGWIYAVAIVVVLAVIVGAVLAFRKRKPDEEPKKPTKKPATTKNATKKTTPKRMAENSLSLF
jgi:hypothetical protein